MKAKAILIFFMFLMLGTINAQTPNNYKPYYGGIERTQEETISDNYFIEKVVEKFGSRKEAAQKHLEFGWNYLEKSDLNSAMQRFNQAWLLDPTLTDVDWGYGSVFMAKKEFEQSIYYLQKYSDANPKNSKILIEIGTTYLQNADVLRQKGLKEKYTQNVNKGKACLLKSLAIDDKSAIANRQLAIAYYYEQKLDSSRYYGIIAYKIDPESLHPGFKKAIGIE